MADNEFEKNMADIILDNLENLMDVMAEQVAKKVANDLIELTESTIDEAHLVQRRPLIYTTIANELKKYVEKISGEVKVEE